MIYKCTYKTPKQFSNIIMNSDGEYLTGLWFTVDWFDAFVIDCIWFCHGKRFVIPGTEDMVDEYHNYLFHIIGSLRGMILGLPVCLLVGLIIELL